MFGIIVHNRCTQFVHVHTVHPSVRGAHISARYRVTYRADIVPLHVR